jgi:hypothetical protein
MKFRMFTSEVYQVRTKVQKVQLKDLWRIWTSESLYRVEKVQNLENDELQKVYHRVYKV